MIYHIYHVTMKPNGWKSAPQGLGLKGPSMTCDTDGSSSLTAVHLGGEAVLLKGHGVSNEFSLAGGVAFQLGPVYLAQMQAAGLLGNLGRCFTWDVSAMGYTMGDGCGFVVQKRMAEWVEGRQVLIEGEPLAAWRRSYLQL